MNHGHRIAVRELTCFLLPLCTWKWRHNPNKAYSQLGVRTLVSKHIHISCTYVGNNFVVNVEDRNSKHVIQKC